MSEVNKELEEVIKKIQDKLKPYIFEYISWFIPEDKLPKNKNGSEMMYCFNHHGNGLDNKHKHMKYYPETGTFHCFACNANFNIFKLANLFENKPLTGKEFFTDNVKYLCEKFSIDTTELDELKIGNEEIKHTEMYNIMQDIADYITANANEKFLKARNISKETSILFQVGSINDTEDFENFLKQYKKELLKSLNILKDDYTLNKSVFNKTKLIITFKNIYGKVVGFSAREMLFTIKNAKSILKNKYNFNDKVLAEIKKPKDLEKFIDLSRMDKNHITFFKNTINIPKYTNLKVSEIFKKREILFGFNEIKSKINKTIPVFIIEGNIDVLTAYQKGIYCLSIGGSAITDEQFDIIENKLNKYTNQIILGFDNDLAGQDATYKTSKEIIKKISDEELNNKYSILEYKENSLKDIDENLLKYNSIDEFANVISLFDYYLKVSLKDKKEIDVIKDFVKIISNEESPLNRKQMIYDLYLSLEKNSEINNVENKFSLRDIESEVNYIVNKNDEIAQKLTIKSIDKFKNKIKSLSADEIKPALNTMIREIEDIDLGTKHSSIFETSLNKFNENQELKYTEDPTEFKCGFDMFENRSWTGDELIVLIAKPHIGKTQFMTNISKNFIQMNNNTAVLYISTDDSSRRIENNFISQIGNLNKDFVNEPKNNKYFGLNSQYSNKLLYQEQFKKTINLIGNLIKNKRLTILEAASGIKSLDMILDAIEEFANDKTIRDFQKLVVIDSANKVQVNGVSEEYSKLVTISAELKTAGQKNHCMIMANFETKKFGSRRQKTTFNSIKGSSSIEYDVDFAITLNNPLAELPNPECIWTKDDKNQAVLVPYVSKSKPGGDIMKAYFYKVDSATSIISSFKENELKNIKSKWFADNNNKEQGYINE